MIIKDISGLKAGRNKVVIKLKSLNDSIKFADGTELYLETMYEPASHTQVIGTVAAVPETLYFNKQDSEGSMEHETAMELEVGDKVYMDYLGVLLALADKYDRAPSYPDPRWFEHNGDLYVIIRYEEVYFAIRDNVIIPVNGYCIARPIVTPENESGVILSTDSDKRKQSRQWAEIIYVGNRCTAFFDKVYDDLGDIEEGDCVLFGHWSNQRVEYSLHKTLFKEEGEYFVIQRKWMKALVPAKMKEDIERGHLR